MYNLRFKSKVSRISLYLVAYNEHLVTVISLLEQGADLTIINNNRLTPLNRAANNNYLEVVRLLLNKEADLIIINKYR